MSEQFDLIVIGDGSAARAATDKAERDYGARAYGEGIKAAAERALVDA